MSRKISELKAGRAPLLAWSRGRSHAGPMPRRGDCRTGVTSKSRAVLLTEARRRASAPHLLSVLVTSRGGCDAFRQVVEHATSRTTAGSALRVAKVRKLL